MKARNKPITRRASRGTIRHDKLLDVVVQVVGSYFLDAAKVSIPSHVVVGTYASVYLEQDLQDWYEGCKSKDVQYR